MAAKAEKKTVSAAETKIMKKNPNRKKTTPKVKPASAAAKKQPSVKNKTAAAAKDINKKEILLTDVKKAETTSDFPVQEIGVWKNFIKCLKKYFTFSGRASRYEYFSFGLGFFFITFITSLLGVFCGFFNTLASIFYLLLLIPMFAVLNRRLHDIGKNLWNGLFNWTVYGFVFAAVVGGIAFAFSAFPAKLAVFGALRYTIILAALTIVIVSLRCLIFVCRRGQTKVNQYGDIPALNNPTVEKNAFWIIVFYFTLNIFFHTLNTVVQYTYREGLLQNALQTEAQFIASQDAINAVYAQTGTYTWLNNKSALDMRLVPADMPVADGTGIVSALGLPVSFFGFAESYIIVMDGVDEDRCTTIMQTPWRLMGLQMVQIRQRQAHIVALTNATQCYPCDNGECAITWVLR